MHVNVSEQMYPATVSGIKKESIMKKSLSEQSFFLKRLGAATGGM